MNNAIIMAVHGQTVCCHYFFAEVIMPAEIENNGDCVTVRLRGDIDHHSVTAMRLNIDSALESTEPKRLLLDFAEVAFMDSSGIGLILGRMRVLEGFGGRIAIKNPTPFVMKMLTLSGLAGLVIENKKRGR